MLHKTEVDKKEIAFLWVRGHAGILGNEAAYRAAKKKFLTRNLPHALFRPKTPFLKKIIRQVWQKEWDEAAIVSNKLHEILPKLSDKLLFCKTRKENTVLSRPHIGHSRMNHSFVLKKRRTSCLCCM